MKPQKTVNYYSTEIENTFFNYIHDEILNQLNKNNSFITKDNLLDNFYIYDTVNEEVAFDTITLLHYAKKTIDDKNEIYKEIYKAELHNCKNHKTIFSKLTSELLDVSQGYINKQLNGTRECSNKFISLIAELLCISPHLLNINTRQFIKKQKNTNEYLENYSRQFELISLTLKKFISNQKIKMKRFKPTNIF